MNRRQLLRAGGSLALGAAAVGLLPGGVASASPLRSGSSAPSDSLVLLTSSHLWSQATKLAATDGLVHDPDLDTTTAQAEKFAAVQSVWRPSTHPTQNTHTDKAMATIGLIDLTTREVPFLRSTQVTRTPRGGILRVSGPKGFEFMVKLTGITAANHNVVVKSAEGKTLFKATRDAAGVVHPHSEFEST